MIGASLLEGDEEGVRSRRKLLATFNASGDDTDRS
jgi:hypothetical protein